MAIGRIARPTGGLGCEIRGSCRTDGFGGTGQKKRGMYILNHMVQYQEPVLDVTFAALSDPTRRGVLEQLGRADASITTLADKFHMTLTGMKKHVGVLEQAGLVTTEKGGRVRTCKLGLRGSQEEAARHARHRQRWGARL